jgi:hypothetical protein
MSKSLEELILGPENRTAVRAAVKRAVERADAMGLPKAYEPEFSAARKVREAEEKHQSMAPK